MPDIAAHGFSTSLYVKKKNDDLYCLPPGPKSLLIKRCVVSGKKLSNDLVDDREQIMTEVISNQI